MKRGTKRLGFACAGNQPDYDGFFPCDKDGNEMEPVEGYF